MGVTQMKILPSLEEARRYAASGGDRVLRLSCADRLKPIECLTVAAMTPEDDVMAVRHTQCPVFGVQFHPESIPTPDAKQMLRNIIEL